MFPLISLINGLFYYNYTICLIYYNYSAQLRKVVEWETRHWPWQLALGAASTLVLSAVDIFISHVLFQRIVRYI